MLGDSFLAEQRLLVVAPHPDDEAIGCAGTTARVKALGGQAYVMIASAGGITQHGRGAGPREPTSRCCEGCPRRREGGARRRGLLYRAVAHEHQVAAGIRGAGLDACDRRCVTLTVS